MGKSFRWIYGGLFLTTVSTLIVEILNARLLSVLTWYHLSFLAVSVAMLGMAAGAVFVFLKPSWMGLDENESALPRFSTLFAISIAILHIVILCIPIPILKDHVSIVVIAMTVTTILIAIPFFLSGVVVTIALTRTDGPIGRLYSSDLLGAASGCLLVILILNSTNITSAFLLAAAIAAIAAHCFDRFYSKTENKLNAILAILFAALAIINSSDLIQIPYPKNKDLWLQEDSYAYSAWNTHSYVIVKNPMIGPAYYWGPLRGGEVFRTQYAWILIDGEAGTPITKWDGQDVSLNWIPYDVTILPYYFRHGDAAIIGVGGGRDLLAAIWGKSISVTGIEINSILLDLITDRYRDFSFIANRPEVMLVHDEARSYLSRVHRRYDIVQMSLIDTWAATGAGAFTLTENGLYTVEGWRVFLRALKPHGVLSVSRWFSPSVVSETNRLVALGTAALLDRGVQDPSRNMILVSRDKIATFLTSVDPFETTDVQKLIDLSKVYGFSILLAPGINSNDPRLAAIAQSKSSEQLEKAVAHPDFDFSPPTDSRPFFFNMLKPTSFYRKIPIGGVLEGNLTATYTLVLLFLISVVLVAFIIFFPLIHSGMPAMNKSIFVAAFAYFSIIGFGFMLIQIALMQRFSVYLGHPTFALAIILFAMILFTGIGSFISDRISIEKPRWTLAVPFMIGLTVLLVTFLITPCTQNTVQFGLLTRSLISVAFMAPLSILLGFCFPLGMRVLSRISDSAKPWMWGVNGASSVLASITAVGISMWLGIHINLIIAAILYICLIIPARKLAS